ncbi:MAG: zinc dependent phospholipase C family protein [Erysipelotrichaceae bacterium]|nr:zinc dependent phospholipase C family protein [Erysipelotrichaceae bacterium]
MPNLITHHIFAHQAYKQLSNPLLLHIISEHSQLYGIGSSGPDFMFFYHMRPWKVYKDHTLNHLGSLIHSTHINDFYAQAINIIKQEANIAIQSREIAYLMGHVCHWALDTTTHPYIFYRTGNCRGVSAGYHHRFESMLDAMMLQKWKQTDIASYDCSMICAYDQAMLQAIARIYVPICKDLFHQDIKVNQIRECLDSWKQIQKLLRDPKGRKTKALKVLEGILHQPWMISGNVIPNEIDDSYDILNLNKKEWKHPCDAKPSHASFFDLYDRALQLATQAMDIVYACIYHQADLCDLFNLLGNRAYDTGREEGIEMKYFDVIYDETV